MRCALAVLFAALALAPAAAASPPAVTATASPAAGAAPLAVTLTAAGDEATYRWYLGDGTRAGGATVEHTYARGSHVATVIATNAAGETAQATVRVVASAVTLVRLPRIVDFGHPLTLHGVLVPARAGAVVFVQRDGHTVGSARTGPGGAFRLTTLIGRPGTWTARAAGASSEPFSVRVRPRLTVRLEGTPLVGRPLALVARLEPAAAGPLRVSVARDGRPALVLRGRAPWRLALGTTAPARLRLHVQLVPAAGYSTAAADLGATLVLPRLAYGATGSSVVRLAQGLRALHYASPGSTASFDGRLLDAVYAFQKVQGLPRTGVADEVTWRVLARPRLPVARFRESGEHIEVDKAHQVLYVVRDGDIALIVPVSTAGLPGKFTPVGRFAIYRKVTGFDPSPLGTLFDPMYFTGGYAIHGNPSVPPYPASHGCVRVPMWVAPLLYASSPYGETVYVY